MNEPTLTDSTADDGAAPPRAKILRFPTLIAESESSNESGPLSGALAATASRLSPRTALTRPARPAPDADGGNRRSLLARAGTQGSAELAPGDVPDANGASLAPAVPAPTPAHNESPWQRFALVRRRRADRSAERPTPSSGKPGQTASRPTVPQLITWLLNLRRGGVGSVYWNVSKLHIDTALMRAARLDDDAIVDVVGHRVLVVEPLRPRVATDPALEAALETLVQSMPEPGPGMVVP